MHILLCKLTGHNNMFRRLHRMPDHKTVYTILEPKFQRPQCCRLWPREMIHGEIMSGHDKWISIQNRHIPMRKMHEVNFFFFDYFWKLGLLCQTVPWDICNNSTKVPSPIRGGRPASWRGRVGAFYGLRVFFFWKVPLPLTPL